MGTIPTAGVVVVVVVIVKCETVFPNVFNNCNKLSYLSALQRLPRSLAALRTPTHSILKLLYRKADFLGYPLSSVLIRLSQPLNFADREVILQREESDLRVTQTNKA